MTIRSGLVVILASMIFGSAVTPTYAEGILSDLRDWERTNLIRQANVDLAKERERQAFVPCEGEQALCSTQLIGRGWKVVSSAAEPLGVDIALVVNLLQQEGHHKICTTFISHDGVGHERPCQAMTANLNSVKD